MSTDFLYRKFGDVSYPVGAGDVSDGQLFSALDPGRDQMLRFFTAVINQELAKSLGPIPLKGSAWELAIRGTALATQKVGNEPEEKPRMPVADTYYQVITRAVLRETRLAFPLLTLYRGTAVHEEHSLAVEKVRCNWGLDYILGPLNAGDYRRLGATLNGVRMIIALLVKYRRHPAYQDNAIQFGGPGSGGLGGFNKIRIVGSTEGPAEFGEEGRGVEYHALHIDIETEELEDVSQPGLFHDFEGANVSVGVGGTESVASRLIEVYTDANPNPNHGDPPPGG